MLHYMDHAAHGRYGLGPCSACALSNITQMKVISRLCEGATDNPRQACGDCCGTYLQVCSPMFYRLLGICKTRWHSIRNCVLNNIHYLRRADVPRAQLSCTKAAEKKRFVIKWIETTVKKWGQAIPNMDEWHMPPGMNKRQLYTWYCAAWVTNVTKNDSWANLDLESALSRRSSLDDDPTDDKAYR